MDLNIERRQIGFFYLGQTLDLPDKNIEGPGYIIHIRDGLVQGISLNFSSEIEREETELRFQGRTIKYVSETPKLIFDDKVIMGDRKVTINQETCPEDIVAIFEVACDCWDDGSYSRMNFTQGECEFKFSWSWVKDNKKTLDYMLIERT